MAKTKKVKKATTPAPIEPEEPAVAEPTKVPVEVETETPVKTAEPAPAPATSTAGTPSASTPKIVRAAGPTKRKLPVWAWVAGGLVLIAAATVAGYIYWSAPTQTVNQNQNQNTNTDTGPILAARLVDGVMVESGATNPNLMAVMIENSSDARPQAGLDKASVVYEALAEGGITRFMALFTVDTAAPIVGPIRSARPYYIDWASEYNRPLYVHAGESPQAMQLLRSKKTTVLDLNLLRYSKYGYREARRAAPHNLMSSSERLVNGFTERYPERTMSFTPWQFADDPAIDTLPESVTDITINYSAPAYKVTYSYDRGQNQYLRSIGGQPHKLSDGTQLSAKNVVVQFVATGLYPKEKQRLQMTTVGTGKALIFRNGQAIVGTWKKTTADNRTVFFDDAGEQVTLTRGATWVSVVPTDRSVTYEVVS